MIQESLRPTMAFSPGYKRYVLLALTSVYLLNIVDRGLVMLLLQPIKEDLALTDTQLGFLTGLAFAVFYATLGIPMARWADRGNRVVITSVAIGLWGLTVMACLFVTSYIQLVVARIAAAVGESGCTPPTYSLVGDYFPDAAERSRAMGIYVSGSTLSALASFVAGGWLNERYGWRITFFIMGVVGLVLAVLIKCTVREPRVSRPVLPQTSKQPSTRAVLRILWQQRSCRHLCLSLIVIYLMSFGLSPWYAAFMIRRFGMSTAELGVWLGLIVSFAGTAGVLLGGYVAGRWFARNERNQLRICAVTVALLVPCLAVFLLVPRKHEALIALVPLVMGMNFFFGPVYALLQRLVPDQMRATMLAVVMLFANLIGMGLGPQLVGILSDALARSQGVDSLRYAMLIISSVALWGAYHLWRVGESVSEDLLAAERGQVAGK